MTLGGGIPSEKSLFTLDLRTVTLFPRTTGVGTSRSNLWKTRHRQCTSARKREDGRVVSLESSAPGTRDVPFALWTFYLSLF